MKFQAAVVLTFFCFISLPELFAQSDAPPPLTFNHLALSVRDVNRSSEFYRNVLGLTEITNRARLEGVRWFSLGEQKELHLIAILKDTVTVNKAVHLALTTSDFDLLIKILERMKVAYSDWPGTLNKINIRADGIKQIFFQDPDGYWIEVNSVAQK
ncbi:MAG: VOC family protein [Bacteroidota bacterium]